MHNKSRKDKKEIKTNYPTGVMPFRMRLYLAKELLRLAGQTIIGESWTENLLKAKHLTVSFGINLKIK